MVGRELKPSFRPFERKSALQYLAYKFGVKMFKENMSFEQFEASDQVFEPVDEIFHLYDVAKTMEGKLSFVNSTCKDKLFVTASKKATHMLRLNSDRWSIMRSILTILDDYQSQNDPAKKAYRRKNPAPGITVNFCRGDEFVRPLTKETLPPVILEDGEIARKMPNGLIATGKNKKVPEFPKKYARDNCAATAQINGMILTLYLGFEELYCYFQEGTFCEEAFQLFDKLRQCSKHVSVEAMKQMITLIVENRNSRDNNPFFDNDKRWADGVFAFITNRDMSATCFPCGYIRPVLTAANLKAELYEAVQGNEDTRLSYYCPECEEPTPSSVEITLSKYGVIFDARKEGRKSNDPVKLLEPYSERIKIGGKTLQFLIAIATENYKPGLHSLGFSKRNGIVRRVCDGRADVLEEPLDPKYNDEVSLDYIWYGVVQE